MQCNEFYGIHCLYHLWDCFACCFHSTWTLPTCLCKHFTCFHDFYILAFWVWCDLWCKPAGVSIPRHWQARHHPPFYCPSPPFTCSHYSPSVPFPCSPLAAIWAPWNQLGSGPLGEHWLPAPSGVWAKPQPTLILVNSDREEHSFDSSCYMDF